MHAMCSLCGTVTICHCTRYMKVVTCSCAGRYEHSSLILRSLSLNLNDVGPNSVIWAFIALVVFDNCLSKNNISNFKDIGKT